MASSIETTSTTTTLKNNGNTYMSVDTNDNVTVTNDISVTDLAVTGNATLTNPLPVASGGTGSTTGGGLGVGQTWQNMIGSRAASTTYTNTTGRPMKISINYVGAPGQYANTLTIGGTVLLSFKSIYIDGGDWQMQEIIPNGVTYSLYNGGRAVTSWWELR